MSSTTARLPEFFDAAADHITAVGLHQGDFYDLEQHEAGTPAEQCRMCAMGALIFAIYGHPHPAEMTEEQCTAYLTGANLAYAHLRQWLSEYSDTEGRTAEDVAEAMRAIAARTRSGDLPFAPHDR